MTICLKVNNDYKCHRQISPKILLNESSNNHTQSSAKYNAEAAEKNKLKIIPDTMQGINKTLKLVFSPL